MYPNENTAKAPCRIYLGTSGYSFPEWIEAGFYPPGTAGKDMLAFYASQFNAIELNYTWYQMPKAEAMERMLSRVPPDFVFTAKLTRTMTHEIDSKSWRAQVGLYRQGMAPLIQAGRLRAILVKLSWIGTSESPLMLKFPIYRNNNEKAINTLFSTT